VNGASVSKLGWDATGYFHAVIKPQN